MDNEDLWRQQLLKNQGLYNNLQLPDYQWQNISPQQAQYQTIAENTPDKQAMQAYLAKLSGLSDTGFTEADQAALLKNNLDAAQMARAGRESALAHAAHTGQAGSGLEYALRAQAEQAGANQAQAGGLGQIEAAARQKALYNQAYGQGLQNQSSQNYNRAAANAGIINQFNMANTGANNQAQYANAAGKMGANQANWQAQLSKLQGQYGAGSDVAKMYAAQADEERKKQQALWGAIGGLAGTGIGAYAGGAEGAKAGGTTGSAVGQGLGGY